jgi:hypothetical protein
MDAIVTAGSNSYMVAYDGTLIWHAVATGEILDDADGTPIAGGCSLIADEPLLKVRLSDDRYALMGDPDIVFTDQSIPHPVVVQVTLDGYRPVLTTLTVPAYPSGPLVQDIELRRLPFTLRGRVFGLTGGLNPAFDPVAAAEIDVIGPPGPAASLPLLLRQPLRETLGPGAKLRGRALAAIASVTAAAPALAGDDHIALADGTGVAATQLLRFGSAERGHWAEVASVQPDPDRPAPASLAWTTEPLSGSVDPALPIARFTPGALSGPTGNPVGAAYQGEALVYLDAIPSGGDVVRITEPGKPDRYHARGAVSDALGDYLIEGIARLGTVTFQVAAGGFTTQTLDIPTALLRASPLDWRLV